MLNKTNKYWAIGLLIILFYVLFAQLSILFNDYLFYRVGINRKFFLMTLYIFPCVASFIAAYYSQRKKLFLSLSYLLIVPLASAIAHYICGELGGKIDFSGVAGAFVVFKISLFIDGIFIIIGSLVGIFFSKS